MNRELQQDELDSLMSIYEEEIEQFDDPDGQTVTQLALPVIVPDEGICINIYEVDPYTSELQMMGNFTFQYVPPVTVSFRLPAAYPGSAAPQFTVSTTWLSRLHLELLCQELDRICESEQGGPILFSLCDWIQHDFLALLYERFPQGINLVKETSEGDPRAQPQCLSLEDTVRSLMQFDRERKVEEWRRDTHECDICLEEKSGAQFDFVPCCRKGFCHNCLVEMCTRLVNSGSFSLLQCPNCNVEYHPDFLKMYLDAELMERWERLTLQRSLEAMQDVHYCPRCESVVISEENFAQCGQCQYAFCAVCLDSYHSNSSCDEMAALLRQARQSKDRENELKTLRAIQRQARKCPTCHIFISRTHGCNKMTCSQCQGYFCYSCGKSIKGYDHFNTTPGVPGGCKIFDEVTDDMLLFYGGAANPDIFGVEGFGAFLPH